MLPGTGFHGTFGLSLGSCVRNDPDVGTVDYCGEANIGVDWAITEIGYWRANLELGVGWTRGATSGYADLGTFSSAGGPYFAPRLLFGRDATRHFYWRIGAQMPTFFLNSIAPGVDGVIDLGTRAWDRLELGPRAFVGVEPVTTTGGPWTYPMSYGVSLLARYLIL